MIVAVQERFHTSFVVLIHWEKPQEHTHFGEFPSILFTVSVIFTEI